MKIVEIKDIIAVEDLLASCSLPSSDVKKNNTLRLYGIYQNRKLAACVGIEGCGHMVLLRSLAVRPQSRNKGIGVRLVEYVENTCRRKSIKGIFLLTNTAELFFARLGYRIVERGSAPAVIRSTAQFSELCPDSSILMSKLLGS